MSLVFDGTHTEVHHQYFRMVDLLMHHFEQGLRTLNPHAAPHVPNRVEEVKETSKNDVDANVVDEHKSDWKIQRKNIAKRNMMGNANNAPLNVKNINTYSSLEDEEEDDEENINAECYNNNKPLEATNKCIKCKMMKSNLYHVDDVETDLLNKTIKTFVERDKNNNEEDLHEELEMINNAINQVIIALSYRVHEDLIDIKTILNAEVISKEGDDLTWHEINSKWCGTILNVKEIMQLQFYYFERTKSRDNNEYEFNNSADDDEKSCKYYSESKDSMGMEYDDDYDFDHIDDRDS